MCLTLNKVLTMPPPPTLSGMKEQVLVLHLANLLEGQLRGDGQHLELVPQYLPLLREPNRELIARELLQVQRGEST